MQADSRQTAVHACMQHTGSLSPATCPPTAPQTGLAGYWRSNTDSSGPHASPIDQLCGTSSFAVTVHASIPGIWVSTASRG